MVREFAKQQGESEKKEGGKNLFYIFGIVVSLSGLFAIIINVRASLDPLLFNFIVAGCGIAIFALLGFYFVVQPLQPRWNNWRRESRVEELSSEFLSELSQFVSQFEEVGTTKYQNGIHMALQSFRFRSLPDTPKERVVEENWMQTLLGFHQRLIDSPIDQIDDDLKRLKVGSKKFLLLHFAGIFWNLLWTYRDVFVRHYVDASKRVRVENTPYDSKVAYAKFQPKFNEFILSYKKFARKVNQQMELGQDQRRVGEYIEDAPPLI